MDKKTLPISYTADVNFNLPNQINEASLEQSAAGTYMQSDLVAPSTAPSQSDELYIQEHLRPLPEAILELHMDQQLVGILKSEKVIASIDALVTKKYGEHLMQLPQAEFVKFFTNVLTVITSQARIRPEDPILNKFYDYKMPERIKALAAVIARNYDIYKPDLHRTLMEVEKQVKVEQFAKIDRQLPTPVLSAMHENPVAQKNTDRFSNTLIVLTLGYLKKTEFEAFGQFKANVQNILNSATNYLRNLNTKATEESMEPTKPATPMESLEKNTRQILKTVTNDHSDPLVSHVIHRMLKNLLNSPLTRVNLLMKYLERVLREAEKDYPTLPLMSLRNDLGGLFKRIESKDLNEEKDKEEILKELEELIMEMVKRVSERNRAQAA